MRRQVWYQARRLTTLSAPPRQQTNQAAQCGYSPALVNERIINDRNVVSSSHVDCEMHGMSLVQKVFQSASRWPDRIATECGVTGRKYTYEAMRQSIKRFASSLTRLGFKKGDVFGMILPNLPEYPIALLGASGVGMPVTLLNPLFTLAEEMARQLNKTQAKAIIGVPQMADALTEVAKQCPDVRCVILLGPPQEGFIPAL